MTPPPMESKEVILSGHSLKFEPEGEVGEFFISKAAQELRETPDRKDESLENLKKLLAREEELIMSLDEDHAFLAYLRACKFYPESAFERICNNYKLRAKYPKYCGNLLPTQQKSAFQNNLLNVLPYRDQHGRRILLIEAGKKWDPKEVSLPEFIQAVLMLVDGAMMEPKTQIAGAVVILDFEGLSLQQVWQFSPNVAKMLLDWIQECIPCRIKAVHVINQPYIFNMLFAIFKPFIREKLRNRIFFHGYNRASLLEHIEGKCLPIQYGGDIEFDTNEGIKLHQLLSEYTIHYERGNKYGYKKIKGGKKHSG